MGGSSTTSNILYLGDKNTTGVSLGQGTTSKISLYGGTPIAQRANANQAAVTVSTLTTAAITTTTNAYGFASTTQVNDLTATVAALVTLVNELRSSLVPTTGIGAIKGSA